MKGKNLAPILLESKTLDIIPEPGFNPTPEEYNEDMGEFLEEEDLGEQCIMSTTLCDEERVSRTIEFRTAKAAQRFFDRLKNLYAMPTS